jgi:hypothetical protein
MNRIDYIKQKLDVVDKSKIDYAIISSLIYALTPIEACEYLDLTFKQDNRIRRYILKKIASDISKSYIENHKQLIKRLLTNLEEKQFRRKESCAFSLNFLFDSLPTKVKQKIIQTFLISEYPRNRDRAFKRLNLNWDKKYLELIEAVWFLFHDTYCLKIILNHFPTTFLVQNYKDILEYTLPFQASKLFIKLGKVDIALLDKLMSIDEISYCYVLTKFNKAISSSEAKRILEKHSQDERVGLLLYSLGQMGLFETIMEYDNRVYRENVIV